MNRILFVDDTTLTVELFGTARHQAGLAVISAHGRTIADLLRSVERACPRLAGLILSDGQLSRRFLISIDGVRFVNDPAEPMPPGSRLLILGADAGG